MLFARCQKTTYNWRATITHAAHAYDTLQKRCGGWISRESIFPRRDPSSMQVFSSLRSLSVELVALPTTDFLGTRVKTRPNDSRLRNKLPAQCAAIVAHFITEKSHMETALISHTTFFILSCILKIFRKFIIPFSRKNFHIKSIEASQFVRFSEIFWKSPLPIVPSPENFIKFLFNFI